jgi:hypothetical protein
MRRPWLKSWLLCLSDTHADLEGVRAARLSKAGYRSGLATPSHRRSARNLWTATYAARRTADQAVADGEK